MLTEEERRRRDAAHKREVRRLNPEHYRAQEKASRLRHIERVRAASRDYHRRHRERLCVYRKEWHKENRELMHARKMFKHYGMKPGEYETMLAAQGMVCAICGGPETQIDKRSKLPRRLAVDHDHVSGKVRGLLCHACNIILGHVADDAKKLHAAASYLERNTPAA